MSLDTTYPALSNLARKAKTRLPHFVWEYLDSATGNEAAARASTQALDRITLVPRSLRKVVPDLKTDLLGQTHALPFGIAPVGMSGLIWPGAEIALARAATRHDIPYTLSTVAAATPEDLAPHIAHQGWFQLYAPGDAKIRRDLLARAKAAGFHTLVLTVDVPVASRRERQQRAKLTNPMRLMPGILAQIARRPAWALATARAGIPKLRTLEPYGDTAKARTGTDHIGYLLRTAPDWDYLAELRRDWSGPLVIKGVLSAQDAARARDLCDAIWVSNHGGRQFEAAPAPADRLPAIRAAVGQDMPLVVDGGVRSGTDILRLLAKGANFVMLGRAFHHGMAALGPRGIDQVVHILKAGLSADLCQLGLTHPSETPTALDEISQADPIAVNRN